MQCRMCGHEFDPLSTDCGDCGSGNCKGCNTIMCPNCGYGNSLSYEKDFDYISRLKAKLNLLKSKGK